MGKTFTSIPEDKIEWIRKQEVFWVATAPLTGAGHVNVSPKGLRGSLRVEGPTRGALFYSIAIFFGLRSGLRFLEIQEGV